MATSVNNEYSTTISCLDGQEICDSISDTITPTPTFTAAHVLLLSAVLVFLANTSYCSMLVAPLYSRIMDTAATTTSIPTTECLLCMLLFLLGIEMLTVLAFLLVGYKILFSPIVAAEMMDASDNVAGLWSLLLFDSVHVAAEDAESQQVVVDVTAGNNVNLLLIVPMVAWIFCTLASTIVRLALYRSMGE